MGNDSDVVLVDTDEKLRAAVQRLRGAPKLFLDTEFDSSRRGMVVSIIQVSAGREIYLVDAVRLQRTQALGEALGAEGTEWILHAGSQDVSLLVGAAGLRVPPRMFDTQVAWGLLTAEASVSLAYLKYRVCGVRSMKTHQADDWLRRPLPEAQLRYAADDVDLLPDIEAELTKRADELGRRDLICRATAELLEPEREPPSPLTIKSFRNAWQLEATNQAALLGLIDWFNALPPADRQRAPSPKTLIAVASRLPRTPRDLARIKGVSGGLVSRHGSAIVGKINHAVQSAAAHEFEPVEPPAYGSFEELELDAWLTGVRARMCVDLRVSAELVLPSRIVRRMQDLIVEHGTKEAAVDALVGWRRELLEGELRRHCAAAHPGS